VAIDFPVQRLVLGDVILLDLDGAPVPVEATIIREPERTESTIRAALRLDGRPDPVVAEWPLGAMVTVVRGP
jgi:hypothetical protein